MPTLADIAIRDPFVVADPRQRRYYLYGTRVSEAWDKGVGFDVYVSADLADWEGPFPAFRPPAGFWADLNFWAPEVYAYNGRFFMFASFKSEPKCRGTQALVADSLRGPFVPYSDGPLTPADWECLDGHLFVDDTKQPWMLFCHEWLQTIDGTMCAMPLTPDLKQAAGKPVTLFSASAATWAAPMPAAGRENNFVTDGPFIVRGADGALLMLWSTIGHSGYAIGQARSASGSITGPWRQSVQPLFVQDGGHGMIFTAFDGRRLLSIHRPNNTPAERPIFLPIHERDGWLALLPPGEHPGRGRV